MNKKVIAGLFALVLLLSLTACDGLSNGENGPIKASGSITAREVQIAAEMGGQVRQVFVEEGDTVQDGEALFQLDDAMLQAQYNQAAAAVDTAEATVEAARAQLEGARLQYQLGLQASRMQEQPNRVLAWQLTRPEEFSLPTWYFEKDEEITAAEAEVEAARDALAIELSNLGTALQDASNADLVSAERDLAEAQATFLVARQTLDQAAALDLILGIAQEQFDAAKATLDAAQRAYDRILSSAASEDVMEARARAAVAQARYDNAIDRLTLLLTGDRSLQVETAQAGVRQAETALTQAETTLTQAKAALQVLDVQLAKAVVRAPAAGVVLARNLEPGEVIAPGSTVLVIGQLDQVRLTVYVGESRYGRVQLGQQVDVTVDSFPGEAFRGSITHISDKAEFTPRNVQTVDGRQSTVYAIDIVVPNPELRLKPGMPADVVVVY